MHCILIHMQLTDQSVKSSNEIAAIHMHAVQLYIYTQQCRENFVHSASFDKKSVMTSPLGHSAMARKSFAQPW